MSSKLPTRRGACQANGEGEFPGECHLLVTGAAGFIGSHLLDRLHDRYPHWRFTVLDALTYAGRLENLDGVLFSDRVRFVEGDVRDRALVRRLLEGPVDGVVNLAAESHVDRSIAADAPFWETNVLGTQVLLSEARAAGVGRFVQVSTDEVYGALPWVDPGSEALGWRAGADGQAPAEDALPEDAPLRPSSPYAASKAAADLLCLSYARTYGGPEGEGSGASSPAPQISIVRGSNAYGPRQHEEKLIPTLILRALRGEALDLYGDGLHIRDWLHVEDFAAGIEAALVRGAPEVGGGAVVGGGPEVGYGAVVYNLGGAQERTNRQVARSVLNLVDHYCAPTIGQAPDRPGHDRRYAVDWRRAEAALEWRPRVRFEDGLRETVGWFRERWDVSFLP